MVIGADNPAKNVKEFVAWMKAHPDKANYASSSPAFTITTELLKLKSGMPGTMIPYKSSNEMISQRHPGPDRDDDRRRTADGAAGQGRQGQSAGGDRQRALGATARRAEHGGGRLSRASTFNLWSGMFAPAGTPAPIVAKLQKAFAQAIADPGVSGKLKAMAVNPGGATPEQFAKIIQSDIIKFGDVVKAANLKFED